MDLLQSMVCSNEVKPGFKKKTATDDALCREYHGKWKRSESLKAEGLNFESFLQDIFLKKYLALRFPPQHYLYLLWQVQKFLNVLAKHNSTVPNSGRSHPFQSCSLITARQPNLSSFNTKRYLHQKPLIRNRISIPGVTMATL